MYSLLIIIVSKCFVLSLLPPLPSPPPLLSPLSPIPPSPPHLKLEQPQGLSEDEVKELMKEIRDLARLRVGEVMMLEIAQHVQVRSEA